MQGDLVITPVPNDAPAGLGIVFSKHVDVMGFTCVWKEQCLK